MNYSDRIMIDFELHSVNGIKECFENGVDPNATVNGLPLVYSLINMYSRSPFFKNCMQIFVDFGLQFEDKALLSVLLNDAALLDTQLAADKNIITKKYALDCTFTPLHEVSLLHICAEYAHLDCARVLVKHGADVNATAGFDENGFGGHTPIFHTVNQPANICFDVLKFLVTQNANLDITVKGLVWGKGYEWETFVAAVNPLSYAMMGLLRQFQRTEKDIYEVLSFLLKSKYGMDYYPANIPNKYLSH